MDGRKAMAKDRDWGDRDRGNPNSNLLISSDSPTPSTNLGDTKTLQLIDIALPPPPDYIFKYRKQRSAPSQAVWDGGQVSYVPDHVEYVAGEGIFMYHKQVPFPTKGYPFEQAVYAVGAAKRLTINVLRVLASKDILFLAPSLILMGKKRRAKLLERTLKGFNDTADMLLSPYYLEDDYYSKVSKEIRTCVHIILSNLGVDEWTANRTAEIISMFFEYDSAYRDRFQDLMSETTKEKMLDDLPNEVKRLIGLLGEREVAGDFTEAGVRAKFESVAKLLKLMWWIPSLKKAIKEGLTAVKWENWQLDEADIFHTLLYLDYDVRGIKFQQRGEIWVNKFGGKLENCPPRIRVPGRG